MSDYKIAEILAGIFLIGENVYQSVENTLNKE